MSKAKTSESSFKALIPSHPTPPVHQQILLALPSEYIQNLTMSSCPSHSDFLCSNWISYICAWSHTILSPPGSQTETFKIQIRLSLLCLGPSSGLPCYSEGNPNYHSSQGSHDPAPGYLSNFYVVRQATLPATSQVCSHLDLSTDYLPRILFQQSSVSSSKRPPQPTGLKWHLRS